jgi:hypothetical protein
VLRRPPSRRPRLLVTLTAVALAVASSLLFAGTGSAAASAPAPRAAAASAAALPAPVPSPFGPGVYVFDPSMAQADIQATVNAIAAQQVPDQMGTGRYALLFKPGTYGTAQNPLRFEVGYYTEVAGLGANPGDVVINGAIEVHNQCIDTGCFALENFWRSMSNLTINVAGGDGCYFGDFWAVSQAAPMRRVAVNGQMTLMDYCTGPSYASGGFIADSALNGNFISGSQQQWLTRNSSITSWSNGVWNQVFAGVQGAPATNFGVSGGVYTTLDKTGLTAERPYLAVDGKGKYNVHVPKARTGASGTSWSSGAAAESVLPLSSFFLATPSTSIAVIDAALVLGKNLIFTPGVYNLKAPVVVSRPGTVVLGLGFPTLVPQKGSSALTVLPGYGVRIAGLIVDAGPVRSPSLIDVGLPGPLGRGRAADPTVLSDVFIRIGGAAAGKTGTAMVVNSSYTVLDDIWSWRADHGTGVGWTVNTADTGLLVNGDNVTAYGLFVEHYQKTEVIWRGANGTVVMFQNENPYDPPSQAAWQQSPGNPGYPALEVTKTGKGFTGYGLGSYSYFNQGVDIHNATAFRTPTSGVELHSLLTVFLNGSGGIDSIVNGVGAPVNSGTPMTSMLVSYP